MYNADTIQQQKDSCFSVALQLCFSAHHACVDKIATVSNLKSKRTEIEALAEILARAATTNSK